MIDEQKLLDWLTRESTDSTKPLVHRTAYRRLLSKIDNGEFAPNPDPTSYDVRFPGAREKYLQPSYDYSRIRLHDDDDQW